MSKMIMGSERLYFQKYGLVRNYVDRFLYQYLHRQVYIQSVLILQQIKYFYIRLSMPRSISRSVSKSVSRKGGANAQKSGNIKRSVSRSRSRSRSREDKNFTSQPYQNQVEVQAGSQPKIVIFNLPDGTSEDDLSEEFAKFGQIIECKVITKNDKTMAFLRYDSMEAAKNAIQNYQDQDFKGVKIRVIISKPKEGFQGNNNSGRGQNNFRDGKRVITCFKCQKEGHMSRQCTEEQNGQNGMMGDNGNRGQGQRKPPTCFKCNQEGHISRNCTNEATNERKVIKCFKCQQEGHMSSSCTSQSTNQRKPPTCFKCQEVGHISKNCTNQSTNERKPPTCFKCQEVGHISKNCTNQSTNERRPPTCFKCQQVGHISRNCTNETSMNDNGYSNRNREPVAIFDIQNRQGATTERMQRKPYDLPQRPANNSIKDIFGQINNGNLNFRVNYNRPKGIFFPVGSRINLARSDYVYDENKVSEMKAEDIIKENLNNNGMQPLSNVNNFKYAQKGIQNTEDQNKLGPNSMVNDIEPSNQPSNLKSNVSMTNNLNNVQANKRKVSASRSKSRSAQKIKPKIPQKKQTTTNNQSINMNNQATVKKRAASSRSKSVEKQKPKVNIQNNQTKMDIQPAIKKRKVSISRSRSKSVQKQVNQSNQANNNRSFNNNNNGFSSGNNNSGANNNKGNFENRNNNNNSYNNRGDSNNRGNSNNYNNNTNRGPNTDANRNNTSFVKTVKPISAGEPDSY